MTCLVTPAEVKEIMTTNLTEDQISPFINSAHLFISKILGNSDLEDERLVDIEKWFTAHLIASTIDRTASSEQLGNATIKYTGTWGAGLDSTPFGQIVQQLDTTGLLASSGKSLASIYAVKER